MKLSRILLALNLLITLGLCFALLNNKLTKPDFSNEIIKVRGLVVVGSSGVERVIIGSPLPDPTIHGYRISRGENASISGIMLYDSEGQERGGYVTDNSYGNVFLTLDSKTQQNALFIADPLGGGAMQIWGRNGNKISLAVGDEDIYMDFIKNNKALKIRTDEKE
ncbi:hypothetical protein [Polaribacter porphyrae]|uniref:Uncharacterized protein n=1 Tax=Polaribacter porphyrae TaxID=1137780 RepID=A0A2S7WRE7_9FLAO|nr:hypothetical protein [Polaribacter porphyrae]PQJ79872.1 hypothetical protein BTO18_12110 [Polaribacter porphyrae]